MLENKKILVLGLAKSGLAVSKLLASKNEVIATDQNHWEKIKQEFNGKKKVYEYIEEDKELVNVLNKKSSATDFSDFKDIIEYN